MSSTPQDHLPVDRSLPSVTLLIPAFNEQDRIGDTLTTYAQYFSQHHGGRWKIIVILNGCRDATLEVVQHHARMEPRIRALEFKAAIGKGGALIQGLRLESEEDFIGYTDADGATPPAAMLHLLKICATQPHGMQR